MAKYYKTHYIPLMDEKIVIQILLHRSDLRRLAELLDPDDPLTTLIDLERDLEVINQTLDMLPQKKRERIEVYLFSGKTQAEQAELFNTSQPNIKRDFMRAIRSLIRLMSPKVENPHSPYAQRLQDNIRQHRSKNNPGT